MSTYCLNGEFINENSSEKHLNRGFLYGDGLFETLIYENKELKFFDDHCLRLRHGLNALSINFSFSNHDLETFIIDLLKKKEALQESNKVKIVIWRNEGGLYTPTDNDSSFMITTQPYTKPNDTVQLLGVSKKTTLPKTDLGNLKTISALPYVLASLEKKETGFDELLILNTNNEICECTSSNIFWKKNGTYYTPSLASGCIAGVMRKQIIEKLKKEGKTIIEGDFFLDELKDANEIFISNITGIKKVVTFKGE